MTDFAIKLTSISKKYNLTDDRPLLTKHLFMRPKSHFVWALKDVSLNIKKGETVGIIGANGSGKSTLLKIIAGITTPTTGSVQVYGKVASLIELGAGFHPDLTGKENLFLNGALMGLTKSKISQKYQQIVDFADIGDFINQPVRTYSSGMSVRLGFSIAINLDPDILLIDEILAVGDAKFQKKCLQEFQKLKAKWVTILVVSHDLNLIQQLCSHTVLISDHVASKIEPTERIISRYLGYNSNDKSIKHELKGSQEVIIKSVTVKNQDGKTQKIFSNGDNLTLDVSIIANTDVPPQIFGFYLCNSDGEIVSATNTLWRNIPLKSLQIGELTQLSISFPTNLVNGDYCFNLEITDEKSTIFYDRWYNSARFHVSNDKSIGIMELNPKIQVN